MGNAVSYMVFEPMAAAIGVGIDVLAPEGNMIVDIGGGTTEIAVISLGGIVSNKSIRMAGDDLTADIVEYMRRQHNVKVSERMAERIKINVSPKGYSPRTPYRSYPYKPRSGPAGSTPDVRTAFRSCRKRTPA